MVAKNHIRKPATERKPLQERVDGIQIRLPRMRSPPRGKAIFCDTAGWPSDSYDQERGT